MNKANLDWEKKILFHIASLGDVDLFDYWLNEKNLNFFIQDENQYTTLDYAIRYGHTDLIHYLEKKKKEYYSLFFLAYIGDVAKFNSCLINKKLNINVQNEDGDSLLHYVARRGNIELLVYLLKKGIIISKNKKKRTALLEAYASNQTKIATEITKIVVQRNSIKNIPIHKTDQIDNQEQQKLDKLVVDFKQYLRKKYLVRNIFSFPAKHTRRANALIIAVRYCKSINEFINLLNNQLNLCKGNVINPIPIRKDLIDKRWSERIKNKFSDPNKSLFYKTIYTFRRDWFSGNAINPHKVGSAFYR